MNKTRHAAARRGQTGLSLVELLVAMAIGAVLVGGAAYVYVQSRNSFGTNETVARLQETARYAMSVIEPDVRMAGFWGLMNDADLVVPGRASPAEATSALILDHSCGNNYAFDFFNTVEGADAAYPLACPPPGGAAQPASDALTVRRASTNPTAPLPAGTVKIWSNATLARAFSNGIAPGPIGPNSGAQVNDLVVNTYYVSPDSDNRPGLPSLRRRFLVPGGYDEQEIVTGVEDLQVQIGVDTSGVIGEATRYIDPTVALPIGAQAVSVRLWILVRSDAPEVGHADGRQYQMGNRLYVPNDNFRRVLITRTIQLRNSLG